MAASNADGRGGGDGGRMVRSGGGGGWYGSGVYDESLGRYTIVELVGGGGVGAFTEKHLEVRGTLSNCWIV